MRTPRPDLLASGELQRVSTLSKLLNILELWLVPRLLPFEPELTDDMRLVRFRSTA